MNYKVTIYLDLIDVVSSIVKTHGVSILNDPKFWNILSDSYSFGSNLSLRNIFREFLKNGYIKQLLSVRGSNRKTQRLIHDLLNKERQRHPANEDDVLAVLFSISIAIGSSSRNDYLCFSKKSSNPTPSPKSNNSRSKNQAKLSWGEYICLSLAVLFGIIMSFGATIFYLAFFRGWWLFFIILLMGLGQVLFLGAILAHLEESKNPNYKTLMQSILTPFLIAIVLNALMAFLFFSDTFRIWLGQHLHDYSQDAPTIITFVLCIVYVFVIGFGSISFINSGFTNSFNQVNQVLNKKVVISTSVAVLIGYVFLFFYPNIEATVYEYKIRQEEKLIETDYNRQLKTNQELQKERNKQAVDLSFKGIKLGISYGADVETAEALSDFRDGKERYYSIKIDGNAGAFDLYANIENHWSQPDSIGFQGLVYSGETTLDNHVMDISIYEYNKRVPLIVIGFNMNQEDFDNLVKLYTKKYGEHERMTIMGLPYKEDPVNAYYRKKAPYYYSNNYEDCIKNDYVWSFKNGIIRITPKRIMYVSPRFIKEVIDENEKLNRQIEQRQQFIIDSISKEIQRQEEIKREEDYADSIRRANNHRNAINEI